MLTAHFAWLHEHEDEPHGPKPEIWVYCEGGSAELGLDELDAHIRDVESHALRLRALRFRYTAMLQGAELVEQSADPHPARTGTGCPLWCDARADSLAARHVTGHAHSGQEHRASDELWISLRHNLFDRLPGLDLTVTTPGRSQAAFRLTLSEAQQLREHLGELIANAEVCTPQDLLPVDELLGRMGAQVVEDWRLAANSSGYILRDVAPGGRVCVAVPRGLPQDLRDAVIRRQLADVPTDTDRAVRQGVGMVQLPAERLPFASIEGLAA
jgi:hypothetical protein